MAENLCPQCGAPTAAGATECKYCGESLKQQSAPQQTPPGAQQNAQNQQYNPQGQPQYNAQGQPIYQNIYVQNNNDGINPAWPIKSKVVAGILALLLGGIGVHKFYLGKTGMGILYILFCWTGIPGIVAFIEGIMYLAGNDHNFQVKNRCRLN